LQLVGVAGQVLAGPLHPKDLHGVRFPALHGYVCAVVPKEELLDDQLVVQVDARGVVDKDAQGVRLRVLRDDDSLGYASPATEGSVDDVVRSVDDRGGRQLVGLGTFPHLQDREDVAVLPELEGEGPGCRYERRFRLAWPKLDLYQPTAQAVRRDNW